MPRLPIAVSDNTRDKEPPKTWQEFEEFCTDAFPLIQDRFGIERDGYVKRWFSTGYGKTGNKQWGVDVFDYFSPATMQCKRVDKFTSKHLTAELGLLKDYPYCVSDHFIITSLDETDRSVFDYIRGHNATLKATYGDDLPCPKLPKEQLPKLFALNWQDVKKILAEDFFLASKWNLYLFGANYTHLNGLDVNSLERAVRTRHCFLPPGGGRKRPHVLDAIRRLTQPLDIAAIRDIGRAEIVLTETIYGMFNFVEQLEDTMNKAAQFDDALELCSSLDNYSRNKGLKSLDTIAIYHQRIDAIKYLRRLGESVNRFAKMLNDDNYYFHKTDEILLEDGSADYQERYWERIYSFSDHGGNDEYSSLSRARVSREAEFIALEILKVREDVI